LCAQSHPVLCAPWSLDGLWGHCHNPCCLHFLSYPFLYPFIFPFSFLSFAHCFPPNKPLSPMNSFICHIPTSSCSLSFLGFCI
jgi:hypothetical protein